MLSVRLDGDDDIHSTINKYTLSNTFVAYRTWIINLSRTRARKLYSVGARSCDLKKTEKNIPPTKKTKKTKQKQNKTKQKKNLQDNSQSIIETSAIVCNHEYF